MVSTTRALRSSVQATPRRSPSPDELHRLHAKLAFYEQPITTFDRPVENDPTELSIYSQPTNHTDKMERSGEKVRKIQAAHELTESSAGTCFLVRLARRSMAAMRKLLTPRRARGNEKTTRRGEESLRAKRQAKGTTGSGYCKRSARSPPRRRFQEMDEPTRFRLELAGIRVQSAPPSYSVCV